MCICQALGIRVGVPQDPSAPDRRMVRQHRLNSLRRLTRPVRKLPTLSCTRASAPKHIFSIASCSHPTPDRFGGFEIRLVAQQVHEPQFHLRRLAPVHRLGSGFGILDRITRLAVTRGATDSCPLWREGRTRYRQTLRNYLKTYPKPKGEMRDGGRQATRTSHSPDHVEEQLTVAPSDRRRPGRTPSIPSSWESAFHPSQHETIPGPSPESGQIPVASPGVMCRYQPSHFRTSY